MKSSHAIRGMILVCATWLACFGGPSPSMAQSPVRITVTICSINNRTYQPQKGTLLHMDENYYTVDTSGGVVRFTRANFETCQPAAPPAECAAGQLAGASGCTCPVSQIMSDGRCVAPPPPKPVPPVPPREQAGPPTYGRPEEAVDMVGRVKAKIEKDRLPATVQAIENTNEFKDRDLYVFIIDFNGKEVANGGLPAIRRRNVLTLKDENGKRLVKGLIAFAKDLPKGKGGWYPYRWLNPDTGMIADKTSYVERLDDDKLVGVGVYNKPNESIVHVISGSLNSDDTDLQFISDMADVLKDHNVRVLPMLSNGGPPQNIHDVQSTKGIEIGLTLTGILNNFRESSKNQGRTEKNIVYIAKLFDEEVHLIASNDITSIEQLNGKKVNVGAEGSGTRYAMRDIFDALNMHDVEEVSMPQAEAFEMIKNHGIAATALIAGKPVRSMFGLTADSGLHFVPIPFSQPLGADYVPTSLTRNDYPGLIPAGQSVGTVAASVVLVTYDWPRTWEDRYQPVAKFVEAFFNSIDELKKPPHHPKWQEVDLAATLPGWKRFERAATGPSSPRSPGRGPRR
jgi:uncharacterized protein